MKRNWFLLHHHHHHGRRSIFLQEEKSFGIYRTTLSLVLFPKGQNARLRIHPCLQRLLRRSTRTGTIEQVVRRSIISMTLAINIKPRFLIIINNAFFVPLMELFMFRTFKDTLMMNLTKASHFRATYLSYYGKFRYKCTVHSAASSSMWPKCS